MGWRGARRVRGPSRKPGTGRGSLREVQDVSGETWKCLGRVGGTSGRSGMGWGNLWEV